MSRFTNTVAAFATLALAAAPLMAVATGAQAAPVRVQVADLDLSSTQGVADFHKRSEIAARDFCRDHATSEGLRAVETYAPCIAGVKAEMKAKLPAAQRAQLATHAAYALR